MANKISTWLEKPFPFFITIQQKLMMSITLAMMIMFSIILSNPIDNPDSFVLQFFKVGAYGFITFFVTALLNIILPFTFRDWFDIDKWTVRKMILFSLLSIISIGMANALFAFVYDNPNKHAVSFSFFIAVLYQTILIGFFPSVIFVFYGERRLYQRNNQRALELIKALRKEKKNQEKTLEAEKFVLAKNTKDEIEIASDDLFFIKSEGNYCQLVFKNNNVIASKLIRSSLKEMEQIFLETSHIIRCHKSYIVNLDLVRNVTGNAKGYSFHMEELKTVIPVSRSFSKALIRDLKKK